MEKRENMALQVTKEIVVKFVETGRISPGNFTEHFGPIYDEVLRVISRGESEPQGREGVRVIAKGGRDNG
jgi:hypothetical protein